MIYSGRGGLFKVLNNAVATRLLKNNKLINIILFHSKSIEKASLVRRRFYIVTPIKDLAFPNISMLCEIVMNYIGFPARAYITIRNLQLKCINNLYVLSGSRLASISSRRRNGVPKAELRANYKATEAIAFSPPDSYSLLSKTYLII